MDEAIKQRQLEAMDRYGLDALVAYSKDNVAYGLGYTVPSQAVGIRNRQFAVALNHDGRDVMLLTANEAQEAEARGGIADLRPYDEFLEDPMAVLADALNELGVAEGRIGLEMDAIPADRWEDLQRHLPRATWVHGTDAFHYARKIKTPRELDHLRRAARIADLAQAEAHTRVSPDMTEQDLYRLIVDRALAHGAESVSVVQVATAERSSYSNPTPSSRPMRWGDVVKIDVVVSSGGYTSDTGRAIVIGEATREQCSIWDHMEETLAAVEDTIRPGVSTRQLWAILVDTFARHDMVPAIRFLGHGLGLSLHEEPFIAAHTDAPLEAGMVLAIEPIYRVGDIGFHLEHNVIVTEDGCENMTSHFAPSLVVVGARAA